MRILQLFTVSAGAVLALGLFTEAKAAEGLRLQSVVQRVSAPEGQTNITATKTFRIAGTAVDAGGKPVAGAVVECYQNPSSMNPFVRNDQEVKQRVTTGGNGAFNLQVSRGQTVLIARAPGLAPAWLNYWGLAKDMTEERLVFTPPTTLKGVVVDEADKPVADAEVWVSYACIVREKEEGRMSYSYLPGKPGHDYFSTRTAADGKFAIQGFPTNAAADLAISKAGKVLREPQRDGISPDTMRCQPGQQEVKLVVEPAGSIEGKVVAKETGQPLAGMSLWPQPTRGGYFGGGERKAAESGADGVFRVADLAAGSYTLRAAFGTNQPPEWVAETVSVTVESGQVARDVQVSATRGGLLEVIVLRKDDHKPIAGAGVNAYKQAYQTGVAAGSNGLALLRLPPGEYKVGAYKDHSRSEGNDATIEAGRTNHIEMELSPPPKITGVVRDPSGAPVAGLELSVFVGWGPDAGGTKTDANGRYEMEWDPQRFGPGGGGGRPLLLAREVTRNLATAQGIEESTTTLDLRLEPALVVAGRVEDMNGKALSNAAVQINLWVGNSAPQLGEKPTRTDAAGHFEITTLPPGRKYSLVASAKGYGTANQDIQEDADTNRVELPPFVLKVADHTLAGEVVDTDEKPVARASVSMYGEGQPNTSVRTDEKGRFSMRCVRARCRSPHSRNVRMATRGLKRATPT